MTKILVTGGAGFIGTHCLVLLLEKGHDVCVLDNSSNSVAVIPGQSKPESILRVEKLTGKLCTYEDADLRNLVDLRRVFEKHGTFELVIHFAGLKSVGASVYSPLKYYENNVCGSVNLLMVMEEFGTRKIIFSSSSTVYGVPTYLPVDEKHPTGNCRSPYGRTKFIVEEILQDLCNSDEKWSVIVLRYFNPIGAHCSGIIGEDPPGKPRNLIPALTQIGVDRLKYLEIFGNNYDTRDGTAIRGYIHVMDLAAGHVAAMANLKRPEFKGWKAYNLGKGGHTVLEVVEAFETASGLKIQKKFVERRVGDVPVTFADASLAETELNFVAKKSLDEMCEDSWRFQLKNPNGYKSD